MVTSRNTGENPVSWETTNIILEEIIMKIITKKKLRTILLLHEKWLYHGSNGVRADVRGLDLKGVNLHGATP